MTLGLMRYKSFTWSNNPSTCSYTCDKDVIKHKYPEMNAFDIEDLDSSGAIITGNGEFFGPNAYNNWIALNKVFKEHGAGDFYHPIFTDITRAIMKKLDASLEPRVNYVSYTFEIWEEVPSQIVKAVSKTSTKTSTTPTSSGKWYIVQKGDCLSTIGAKFGVKWGDIATANKIVSPYTIYTGDKLWIPGATSTSNATSQPSKVYIVKPGDTLYGIAKLYKTTWGTLATYNKLKNPRLIHPGDKILIP